MQFVNIHLYVCIRIWGYIFMLLALFAIRTTITLILLLLVMPDCLFHLFYFHMTQNELLAWTTKLSGRCQLKRRVAFMLRAYVEVSARAVWIFRFFTRLAEKQMTSNSRNILRFYVVASKRSFFYLNIWIYTFLCT